MARRWGPLVGSAVVVAAAALLPVLPVWPVWPVLGGGLRTSEAHAGGAPLVSMPPPDPEACSTTVEQGRGLHVFDTASVPGGPYYVNDHTIVQAPDGAWHLFGIFHEEPIGPDTETDFVHAVAQEPDPAKWQTGAFEPVPSPYTVALRADRAIGETHLWAPHVVAAEGRYWMIYQGGGTDDARSSIRIAESGDLYRWTRVSEVPLFEDFCVARDPMLVRRDGAWAVFYTRCDAPQKRVSGVAYRISRDLAHWSEPHMAFTAPENEATPNSAFTESPFVLERNGFFYLSVTAYPVAWDATFVYRSPAPFAFPDVPVTRLRAHAAEWITGRGGALWVTHAGPGQRGVWISRVTGL